MLERDQDFTQKIVVVINKTLDPWEVLNTASHVAAYLGNQLCDQFSTGDVFTTKDQHQLPRNSQYAIILLRAKPGQLANLMEKARVSNLLHMGFIREMIETTDDREIIARLAEKEASELEYYGVGLFGPNQQVETLTKAFQLWR